MVKCERGHWIFVIWITSTWRRIGRVAPGSTSLLRRRHTHSGKAPRFYSNAGVFHLSNSVIESMVNSKGRIL
jgi:hypothetical protein